MGKTEGFQDKSKENSHSHSEDRWFTVQIDKDEQTRLETGKKQIEVDCVLNWTCHELYKGVGLASYKILSTSYSGRTRKTLAQVKEKNKT